MKSKKVRIWRVRTKSHLRGAVGKKRVVSVEKRSRIKEKDEDYSAVLGGVTVYT